MNIKVLGATLLSKEEYNANSDIIKELWQGVTWWTRSKGWEGDDYACIVSTSLHDRGDVVDREFAVRPAIELDFRRLSKGTKVSYAGETFTVLEDGLALCDGLVRMMAFRADRSAPNANEYESSDIKNWVEAWFSRNGDEAEVVEE